MKAFNSKDSGVSGPPLGSPGGTVLNGFVRRNADVKLATWNVRSMFEAGRLANATQEMRRMGLDVLGVSEMRWPGRGVVRSGQHTVYYSGNDDARHWNGVAVIVTDTVNGAVRNFIPLSDRVMLIQIQAKPVNMNIIQVYAPTADAEEEVLETFYAEVKSVLRLTKVHEVNIIMGDFNAKVGTGKVDGVVGAFGLGTRNDRGGRLVQFCQEEDLSVMNTFFQLPPRRLYTWRSPQDSTNNIVRNQIDYVLVNNRFRNCMTAVRTYPGADIASDHNPLSGRLQIRLKATKRRTIKVGIDVRKLRNADLCENIREDLKRGFENMNNRADVNTQWASVRDLLIVTGEKHLTADKQQRRGPWMTEEILDLMEQRRGYRTRDQPRYRAIHRMIRNKIRTAKEQWVSQQCVEIEELQSKHDSFHLHKKIKEMTGKRPGRSAGVLVDGDDNIVATTSEQLKVWERYVGQLFEDDRRASPDVTATVIGPDILREEVKRAISKMRSGKAPGPDEVHAELLKTLHEEELDSLTSLCNKIYRTGVIPDEWLKSTFIPIPKKQNAKRCEDHRMISLMSHVLKIFLKIIHERVYQKCEEQMTDTQFGFRGGFGTRDALFAMNVLVQRCRDMNKNVFLCFIDYEKAFDNVLHDKMLEILQRVGLDDCDIRIIANLYWNQGARVRVGEELSEEVRIRRGVRQGCVLSPMLFNLYSEVILSEALDGCREGIIVNGEGINNLRYADDTALIADSVEDLQVLLERVNTISNAYGLRMNIRKTKFMVLGEEELNVGITLAGSAIERVHTYKYLGCCINDKWDYGQEVRARIEQARAVFTRLKRLLCQRDLGLGTRLRIWRCYVLPVLLYGQEGWTLTKLLERRLEAFEMWSYRRMLRVSWTDRVRNTDVLTRMGKEMELLYDIKRRKLQYFGHVMRNRKYRLLQLIMEGKIAGKRRPGRRKTSWLKNLRDWFGLDSTSLFRAAVSKVRIAMMIANLRCGDGT